MDSVSRQRNWVQMLARAVLATLGILLSLAVGMNLWHRAGIRSEYSAMREQGLPKNVEELSTYYAVPSDVLDGSTAWNSAILSASVAMRQGIPAEAKPFFECDGVPLPDSPWEFREAAESCLKALAPHLNTIHSAAAVGGRVRLPKNYQSYFQSIQDDFIDQRDVVRLLIFEAEMAARTADLPRCRNAQMAMLVYSEAIQGQPDVLGMLNWVMVFVNVQSEIGRLLPYSEWTDRELSSIQRHLCSVDCREQLTLAVAGECVLGVEGMRHIPLQSSGELELLRTYSAARQHLTQPWPVMLEKFRRSDSDIQKASSSRLMWPGRLGLALLSPRMEMYAKAMARTTARQSCVNSALAAQRFRLRHRRLPVSLNEIDGDLFAKGAGVVDSTADPLSGQPLRLLINDQRLLVYSVGDNRVDDGGDYDLTTTTNRVPLDLGFAILK